MALIKRKVFISHYKGDRNEVDPFIDDFRDVFNLKILGANNNDEFINSTNTDYVMQCIREQYLGESTVTIVLLGSCTHSRRYVDWETKSSLQQGKILPNGLIGIALPGQVNFVYVPDRLAVNWESGHGNCYARCWKYPSSEQKLWKMVEEAHQSRTVRANLIDNSLPMKGYNSKCKVCGETH
jgi:hypothetical protein